MDNSERIAVPLAAPCGCLRPGRRGQRRGFPVNCISGLAQAAASSNRRGAPASGTYANAAPEAGVRAKKERAAKRMPTFRNPELLYQLQVAILLTQHRKIKHQRRPALTVELLISVNRGLKAGQTGSRPPEWWKPGRSGGVPAQAARGVSVCDVATGARANRSISSSTVFTLADASVDR